MTDKDGGKQHFLNGLLVKEEDASGNTLSILHNASKIVKLTDGSGREVNLAYGSDGHLSKLTDAAGRVTAFGYTNGFLTSITDPDGAVSRFTYDTAAGKGMMLTAADPYGYKVQYSYGSQAPYRVSKVIGICRQHRGTEPDTGLRTQPDKLYRQQRKKRSLSL